MIPIEQETAVQEPRIALLKTAEMNEPDYLTGSNLLFPLSAEAVLYQRNISKVSFLELIRGVRLPPLESLQQSRKGWLSVIQIVELK